MITAVTTGGAIAELSAAFERSLSDLGRSPVSDRAVVVVSWPSVPAELVRAAGLDPLVARGASSPTPAADAHLEADIFPSRLRQLVEAAITGRLAHVARVVVPRTSDPDYKCFLYLRELVRRGRVRGIAPIELFDLLQSHGDSVRTYDVARARALAAELAAISGRPPDAEGLRREIVRANRARAAARRLDRLRRGSPRVAGVEAFPLLGAFWQLDPDAYTEMATAAAAEIAERPPLDGPRVLIAGAPVDTPALHAAIESHGAVVVAETGPWGSGAAGADVPLAGDPVAALAEKYRADSTGARTPVEDFAARTQAALAGVDAVVVSLPPEDTVFGWDYPALKETLTARRIPHTVLRGDPGGPLTSAEHAQVEACLRATVRRRDAHRG